MKPGEDRGNDGRVENEENRTQVSLLSHSPWKSLRDSHIPTVPARRGKVENQRQVFHPSHRPWKSLRDSHIPTASTTRPLYIGEAKTASPKNQ